MLRKAFDTPGPLRIGLYVDYVENSKIFAQLYKGSFYNCTSQAAIRTTTNEYRDNTYPIHKLS
jgi:hypothetical protein